MLNPPVPVLMLYDPAEFWEQVRATIREEIASTLEQTGLVHSALEKARLPTKPAYTEVEIQHLFQISGKTLEEWTDAGLLKSTGICRQVYVLYSDLLSLFRADYDSERKE
jgi:hypothetical protein